MWAAEEGVVKVASGAHLGSQRCAPWPPGIRYNPIGAIMHRSYALAGSFLLGLLCASGNPMSAQNGAQGSSSSRDDQTCKQPACFAGDNGNKSCYICGYNRPNQHTVCTDKGSPRDKDYAIKGNENKDKDQCPSLDKNRGIMGADRQKN